MQQKTNKDFDIFLDALVKSGQGQIKKQLLGEHGWYLLFYLITGFDDFRSCDNFPCALGIDLSSFSCCR